MQELLEDRLRLQGFTNADERMMELIDDEYQDSKIIQNLKFKKMDRLVLLQRFYQMKKWMSF